MMKIASIIKPYMSRMSGTVEQFTFLVCPLIMDRPFCPYEQGLVADYRQIET